jgi:hypothetical protein
LKTVGLVGLTRKPIDVAAGTNSCSSSRRFAVNAVVRTAAPVAFPPGRLRLATRPTSTGSPPDRNTIGIVAVADFAARAVAVPPVATITAPRRRTRSAANAGKRSNWFSAHR